jgi:hypothetical protein
LNPPRDGDDIAPVIPLRQRQGAVPSPSSKREPLPRERAAFDPEIEAGEVALRRPWRRRVLIRFSSARPDLHAARRPRASTVATVVPVAFLVVLTLVVLPSFGSGPARTTASSETVRQHAPSAGRTAPSPVISRRTAAHRPTSDRHHRARRHASARATKPRRMVASATQRASSGSTTATTSTPTATAETAAGSSSGGSAQSAAGSGTPTRQTSSSGTTKPFGPNGALGPGSSPNG